jgi:hypothetical protein
VLLLLLFEAARRKSPRNSAAMIMPAGYATLVLFLSAGISPRHSGAITKYVAETALMKVAGAAAIQ